MLCFVLESSLISDVSYLHYDLNKPKHSYSSLNFCERRLYIKQKGVQTHRHSTFTSREGYFWITNASPCQQG